MRTLKIEKITNMDKTWNNDDLVVLLPDGIELLKNILSSEEAIEITLSKVLNGYRLDCRKRNGNEPSPSYDYDISRLISSEGIKIGKLKDLKHKIVEHFNNETEK